MEIFIVGSTYSALQLSEEAELTEYSSDYPSLTYPPVDDGDDHQIEHPGLPYPVILKSILLAV
jgi:hypothetical protein